MHLRGTKPKICENTPFGHFENATYKAALPRMHVSRTPQVKTLTSCLWAYVRPSIRLSVKRLFSETINWINARFS